MRWLNRDIWKVGITLAGLLLFLVLMIWVPASSIGASERTSEPATPVTGTVQTTPTEDATVAALNKEKLKQEVEQLKEQNDATVIASNKQKLQDGNNWLWNYGATILSSVLSAVLIVGGGIFALLRWLDDRQKERQANEQKQEKERFESLSSVISGLGDEKERVRFGAATMLRSIFLRPGYEQFYRQVFDLAVGHLRLSSTSNPSEDPDGIPPSPEDPNTPLPLRQALIVVFKEAFPLARDKLKEEVNSEFSPQSLDASCVQLDNAYMSRADLKQAWMPQASLREADLSQADLSKAKLSRTDLRKAKLSEAKLSGANLSRIPGTRVARPSLRGTSSSKTLGTLDETDLWKADLSGAVRREVASVIVPEGKENPNGTCCSTSSILGWRSGKVTIRQKPIDNAPQPEG